MSDQSVLNDVTSLLHSVDGDIVAEELGTWVVQVVKFGGQI